MEALNRRAKQHRFRTFYSVVFIEGWRLWFGNDTVSLASLAVHKCYSSKTLKTKKEHCGARWWGLTVLDMLNVIGNLGIIDKASIICLIKRLVGTRTSSYFPIS
jgi:hypothetical protein